MEDRKKIIKFNIDTTHRKQWFTGLSFSHPAKMSLPLQLWLVENFTKEGETILDPMAGSGTLLVACSLGRDVICVELETKFVDMMKGNWEKIQQRGPQMGYEMGNALILQGDARNLTGLMADKIITSPPYAEINQMPRDNPDPTADKLGRSNIGKQYSDRLDNIGNLPYGSIDHIVSSPPFQEGDVQRPGKVKSVENYKYGNKEKHQGIRPENIANLAERQYGDISAIISSPPYEGTVQPAKPLSERTDKTAEFLKSDRPYSYEKSGSGLLLKGYSQSSENIGNLKSASYLSAMLAVYKSCFSVLRPGGLLILITKNFIRDQKEIRLDLDTIKICEKVGFLFQDRWYRKLVSQSFWRTIYARRYPDAPAINFEDILLFVKKSSKCDGAMKPESI